ncbi:MAG: peptidylprolyl isomerase [Chloroflexi bacterium]|nr:peptidylprolyl isomerase [Chloroflexota bacterium]
MKRTALVAGIAAVAALLGAGCGDDRSLGPAATVNGDEITHRSVVDELEAIAANDKYLARFEEAGTVVTGEAPGSFNAAFAGEVLGNQILYQIVHQEIERREVVVDDECRNAAETDQLRRLDPDRDAAEDVFNALPESYRQIVVARQADVLALQGALVDQPCVATDDAVADYYAAHREDFEQACASHILVATQPEAEAVLQELAAGADFATVAQQRSTDTGTAASGGDLGCSVRGAFVAEFEDAVYSAPLNQPIGPVETQFGFHVILVRERGVPDLDEIREEAQRALSEAVSAAFGDWFSAAVPAAEVTVDPRYGLWDEATGTITAPDAGDGSTTTSAP